MPQVLRVWVLNVGHGDSIVIQYQNGDRTSYGVIDSNRRQGEKPKALSKLQELGADELSFIALTHPHQDHYSGLLDLFNAYRGRIKSFYSYPIDLEKKSRLKKHLSMYRKVLAETDDPNVRAKSEEFIRLLTGVHADNKAGSLVWEVLTGPRHSVYPDGFDGVEVEALLPMANEKGRFFERLEIEDSAAIEAQQLNELSLGIRITFQGVVLLLGGDCTSSGWREHRRHFERGKQQVNSAIVKVPHHGSHIDFERNTLRYLYDEELISKAVPGAEDQRPVAAISADGRSHPHVDTLRLLQEHGILPYCTNLHPSCGAVVRTMLSDVALEPELKRLVQAIVVEPTERSRSPCQGSICIEIANGKYQVIPEHAVPCAYRGNYAAILGGPP